MKRIALFCLLATLALGLSFCKKTKEKLNELTEFDMSYNSSFTVPATNVVVNEPVNFTTPDIQTNSGSTFASQKTVADKVSEVKLTRLRMSTTDGNFDYLESVTIFIQAPDQNEAQIATKTGIPNGVSSFDLDVSDVNLKGYVSGTVIRFRINVTLDGPTTKDQLVNLDETLRVKATLIP